MTRTLRVSLALAFALAKLESPGLAASQAGPAPPPDKGQRASPRLGSAAAKASPKPTPPPGLVGSVRGPDGKPLEGALVLYRPLSASSGDVAATARTDAEGRFHVELKTPGPVYVRVTAKGLAGRT